MQSALQQKVIRIDGEEFWDEVNEEFIYNEPTVLVLEHSLVSISQWESKWKVPFLNNQEKTHEQILDYIKCMTVNDVDETVYNRLSDSTVREITEYMEDSMTATWFGSKKNNQSKGRARPQKQITSELIYYWMIALDIPIDFQHWHIRKLLTLIEVCNEENKPKDAKHRFTKAELASRSALNKQRRAAMNTRG